MKKRILSIVLCLSLFMATFATTMVVSAADVNAETGYCADISEYRQDEYTAPTREGKVFAGWFEDAKFETAIAPSKVSGEAYAKFVDPTVFTIQNQFNSEAHKASATVDLRIITTIDSEWYAGIEFTFTCEDFGSKTFPIDTVYTSLVNYDSAKTQFCNDSKYFAVEKITGIPKAVYTKKMSITPIFTTYDGTVVTGTTRGTDAEPLTMSAKLPKFTLELNTGDNRDELIMLRTKQTSNIPVGTTFKPDWSDGGFYVNGEKKDIAFVKYSETGYYIMVTNRSWGAKYDYLTEAVKISMQGSFVYDGVTIEVEPVTFEFATGTNWKVVYNKEINPVTITGPTNGSSLGTSLLFKVDGDIAPGIANPHYGWKYGGVYYKAPNSESYTKLEVPMYSSGATWVLYFPMINFTIEVGAEFVLNGTFEFNGQVYTFAPENYTFVVSDAVDNEGNPTTRINMVEKVAATVYDTSSVFRIEVTPTDSLPHDNATTWNYTYWAADNCGVYTKAVGADEWTRVDIGFIKISANKYMLYGLTPTDGMQVKFGGIFRNEAFALSGIMFDYIVMQWDASANAYTLISE